MKKIPLLLIIIFLASTGFSQNPDYRQRLYYTCKVWGFVKYFHSRVSTCQVNWDSVLLHTLPMVKNAASGNEFNDAIDTLLGAAGPMEIATTPSPDTLPPELKRNLNLGWMNDPVFRPDVKSILDTIRINFRPHEICWVKNLGPDASTYLLFPFDDPMVDTNLSINYPDEFTRLLILFKYWNIINYFYPHNYILDKPIDTTLSDYLPAMSTVSNYPEFFKTIKKISANLDDDHVEICTESSICSIPGDYGPRLVLAYVPDHYVVVKSGYASITKGDIIISIDSLTTGQLADSLRPYISAGNPSVFRRTMCRKMLTGAPLTTIKIVYHDSLGNTHTQWTYRNYNVNTPWFWNHYLNDTLGMVKWRQWNGNVGYVNIGYLENKDVDSMYNILKSAAAIIFDIRSYPYSGASRVLGDIMYPEPTTFVKCTCPNADYPGTFHWEYDSLAYNGNSNPYTGTVIILCNEETQSAGEYYSMLFQAMTHSLVVGSQTAGADGNISYFQIGQDMQSGFTSLGVYYPNGDSTQRIGIVPDSVVYPTVEGIRNGRDEVLEKALQVAWSLQSSLSVTPQVQNVTFLAGSTSFSVTSNRNWSVRSDAAWCSVTGSGSNNGTIVANYTENLSRQSRTASIQVTISDLPMQTVTVNQYKSTIGIDDHHQGTFRLFPNPASGRLHVEFNDHSKVTGTLTIRNIFGKEISSTIVKTDKSEIDVSNLEDGVYFVIITSENTEQSIIKLVVTR